MAKEVTEQHLRTLRLYSPNTYGIALNYDEAKELEAQGLVEWVPPVFGSTQWAITEKGKQAVEDADRRSRFAEAINIEAVARSGGDDAGESSVVEGHR